MLDQELERQPSELARILVHELFHFAWVRLGNPARRSYEALVRRGMEATGARRAGLVRRIAETRSSTARSRSATPCWRDYLCESFCDTAAWIYSGVRRHPEYTLAARHRNRRAEWFHAVFQRPR